MDTIYLLEDQVGNYKIGFTKHNAVKRKKSGLLTGNSGDLIIIHEFKTNHNRKVETILHGRLKHKHVVREFYALDDAEVSNFINMCETIERGLDAIKSSSNPFY